MVDTRRGPRRTLSEQAILDAALALLAELGADRVSIRGIATRVGIAPNAVYTYFPDKAAVLAGVAEQLIARVDAGRFTGPSRSWRERSHAVADALRAELLAHPGAVHLLLSSPMTGEHATALGATVLAIMTDAGLDHEDAARAAHLLNVHVLGSVALTTDGADDQFRWGLDRLLDGVAPHTP